MSDLTLNNINAVRYQIGLKINYNTPYYATRAAAGGVLTDFDHFPYTRYYRGVAESSEPVVLEREAGYRPLDNQCYRHLQTPVRSDPQYCWQNACNTVLPCMPKKSDKPCQYNLNFSV